MLGSNLRPLFPPSQEEKDRRRSQGGREQNIATLAPLHRRLLPVRGGSGGSLGGNFFFAVPLGCGSALQTMSLGQDLAQTLCFSNCLLGNFFPRTNCFLVEKFYKEVRGSERHQRDYLTILFPH